RVVRGYQSAAGRAQAAGAVSAASRRENAAFEPDSIAAGDVAPSRGGGLRRRSGHPSESEDRTRLEGSAPTERGHDARQEREALPRRRPGRAHGRDPLGGGGTKRQLVVLG